MEDKVLIIVGPTAVGKSDFAIKLAGLFNGEIISADSQQVYRGLDVGTAKVKISEMQGISHHLLDIKDLEQNFSVYDFVKAAEVIIKEISRRGKLPIIVGGTGLYIQSLVEGYHLGGEQNHESMRELRQSLEKLSTEELRSRVPLKEFNRRRAIRAIELETYGQGENKGSAHDYKLLGLSLPREVLYKRIDGRVDKMIDEGLLDEANNLYRNYPEVQAARAIGYKEFFPYFTGEYSLMRAVELVKQNSRHYAKRQMTWFKNRMRIKFYDVAAADFPENVIIEIRKFLRNGGESIVKKD